MSLPIPRRIECNVHEQLPMRAPCSLSKAEDPMPPGRSLYHFQDGSPQITASPTQIDGNLHFTDAQSRFIHDRLSGEVQLHPPTTWPIPPPSKANELLQAQTKPEVSFGPQILNVSSGYRESAISHYGGRKRIVKVRDRRITSCTQCRDRKLKCSKGTPCARCRTKGEQCIYIDKAQDLHLAPKRIVKKRKRPINVCLTCRDRKIPCKKGLPCANCFEAGLDCTYRRYKRTGSPIEADGGGIEVLGVRDLHPITQPPLCLNVNNGTVQAPPNGSRYDIPTKREYHVNSPHKHIMPILQHEYPQPEYRPDHPYPYLEGPPAVPLLHSHGPSQLWQAALSDGYNPVHDDEGYGSVGSMSDYKDTHTRNSSTTSSYYTGLSASPDGQNAPLGTFSFKAPILPFEGHNTNPHFGTIPFGTHNMHFEGQNPHTPFRNLALGSQNLPLERQNTTFRQPDFPYGARDSPFVGPLPPITYHSPPMFPAPQLYPNSNMRTDPAKMEPGFTRMTTAHMYD